MKLKAVAHNNQWTVTTPEGKPIEDVQSLAEGFMPGYGHYLSVHIRIPIPEAPLDSQVVDSVLVREDSPT